MSRIHLELDQQEKSKLKRLKILRDYRRYIILELAFVAIVSFFVGMAMWFLFS